MTARGGFTLLEMMVVLVMMGIAAAVAAPALRPPAARTVPAAVDSLVRVLARARASAARRGGRVRVEVRDGAFAVLSDDDEEAADTLASGTLPLPADGRVSAGTGGAASVMFDAVGRARADRIFVAGPDARVAVVLDPWSGSARAIR
ncbi:MAG TPA: type II secretion system protein [Longimicrobiaceae bacterium]|jgi:general secretion pathway protein H|nr:type II secretion system protein [Longimicrobiaceae bacterium]